MIPLWLHVIAILSLLTAFIVAGVIAIDLTRHPQHMWIMNLVWPLAALFGSVLVGWFYIRYGRVKRGHAAVKQQPFAAIVGKGALHCGSGCTLGDICAEWLAFATPGIAVWFGWRTIFSEKMFAVWILDFILAFAFGIVFQYFSIAPMRKLSLWPGLVAALKADTLSLTAWQVGMYGLMAIAQFGVFRPLTGQMLEVNTPEFWFTMQIAMLAGFATSYPVNWRLIRAGIKEEM